MRDEELKSLVRANFHGWKRGGPAADLMRRNFEIASDVLEVDYSVRVLCPEERRTYFDHNFMEAVGSILVVPEILEKYDLAEAFSPFPNVGTNEEREAIVYEVVDVGFWDLEEKRLVEPVKVTVASGDKTRMRILFSGKDGVDYDCRFFKSVRNFTDWLGVKDPFRDISPERLKEVWRRRSIYSWILPLDWAEDFDTLFKVLAFGIQTIRSVLEKRLKSINVEPHIFLDAWVRRSISDMIDKVLKPPESWEDLMSLTEEVFRSETLSREGTYYSRDLFFLYLALYVGFFSLVDQDERDVLLEDHDIDLNEILSKLKGPEVAKAEAEVLRSENKKLREELSRLREDLKTKDQINFIVIKEYENLRRELDTLRTKVRKLRILLLLTITSFSAGFLLLLLYLSGLLS